MNEEMKSFAVSKVTEAKDILAQEMVLRATEVNLDIVNNEYKGIILSFELSGATISVKWNAEDRFNDHEAVYDILLRMIYHAEDHPIAAKERSAPVEPVYDEPMGFIFAGEDDD
jgi:hypothetical protein